MKKVIYGIVVMCCFTWQQSYGQDVQLWGTTSFGGINNNGTIFIYDATTNTLIKVHDFSGVDGAQPGCTLLQAIDGELYGLTDNGGANNYGVLFSIDPGIFAYSVLYNFSTNTGSNPGASLVQANNGKFYGTTSFGGANNSGVIFSYDPLTNVYSDIYDLNYESGYNPEGDLIQDNDGLLYGTIYRGGSLNEGVIYSVNPSTNAFSVIYNFATDTPLCGYPLGDLTEGKNGKLLGNAGSVPQGGHGIIFNYNVITNNFGEFAPTLEIESTLYMANNGLYYGTAGEGGQYGYGELLSFDSASDNYTDLHDFDDTDGAFPDDQQTVMRASDGKMYGLIEGGGSYLPSYHEGGGVLYSYDPVKNSFIHLFNFDSTCFQPWANLIQVTATGINQLSANNNQLSIYPNPTNGQINIISSKNIDTLKVTNLLGQIIYISQPKQIQFTFNINETGLYFVTVTSDNETETKKVLVLK